MSHASKSKTITFYISHPYEFWYSAHIAHELERNGANDIELLILRDKSIEPIYNYEFLARKLYPRCTTVKIMTFSRLNQSLRFSRITMQIGQLTKFRRELNSFCNKNKILVLHDKSRIESRIVIAKFKNVILIQPAPLPRKEQHKKSVTLSYKETLRSFLLAVIYRTAPLVVYRSTTNTYRELTLITIPFLSKRKIRTLYRTGNPSRPNTLVLRKTRVTCVPPRKILILGFRFSDWNWFSKIHERNTIKVLDIHLRRYPTAELHYLPHPRESHIPFSRISKEIKRSIKLDSKSIPAECLLVLDEKIDLCIGFSSTALHSALLLGIPVIDLYKEVEVPFDIKIASETILDKQNIQKHLSYAQSDFSAFFKSIDSF